ncbi:MULTISPECIES: hypothetical protein [Gracilibacillus]|uniref:DUF5104 domain-containing protein n=1 Tax=Gracilibacillus thailandensis TaxID=563735 RepID=A0A6N7QZ41_9BACI|nr:hypothetical protein [Gracilibacillus thailandensis]MRI66151.1 hypothetical protein [Gracilibacillus thailandensis]
MKKVLLVFGSLTFIVLLSVACQQQQMIAPADYEDYNTVMEDYFLAYVEEDLYTMKQYLPEDIIEQNIGLKQAEEGDGAKKPDMKENMGVNYSIKGFDYFHEDYDEIYYSIEYYNYKRDGKESLVFGVKKENDDYKVFSAFGHGGIGGSHVTDFNNGDYFNPSNIKEVMSENPDNTFVVKEYPEG